MVRTVFLCLYERKDIKGIRIALGKDDPEDVANAIEGAIELIKTQGGWSWHIVDKYVQHIVVWPGDHTAYDSLGGIHLASTHVREWSKQFLASALIHEATHLRIRSAGIRYTPDLRGRIEAICAKTQAAFLQRLPSPWQEMGREIRCRVSRADT